MERKREFLWVGLLALGLALGWFGWRIRSEIQDAKARVHLENVALERIALVTAAERAYHEKHGRYAWAGDLRAADLLPAGSLDEAGRVASPGYRLDILLPFARGARDLVQIAPRGRGRASERLAKRHFAIVARPSGEALTGYRSFYLDETGVVLQSHGVGTTHEGHLDLLPALHMGTEEVLATLGRRWTRLVPTAVH